MSRTLPRWPRPARLAAIAAAWWISCVFGMGAAHTMLRAAGHHPIDTIAYLVERRWYVISVGWTAAVVMAALLDRLHTGKASRGQGLAP